MLITLAWIPVTPLGRLRRVPHLPRPRRREAVAVAPVRVAARRAGHHGRRRDGGGLRSAADAGAAAHRAGRVCSPDDRRRPSLARGRDRRGRQRAAGDDAARHQLAVHHRAAQRRRASTWRSKRVVGDDRAVLGARAALGACAAPTCVVVCGGLGPTDDDVTRDVVADVLGRPLAEDAALVEHLQRRLRGAWLQRADAAEQPAAGDGAARARVVLDNPNGSAPGLWIDHGAQVVVLLPGPPRELKPMLTALVDDAAARASVRRRPSCGGCCASPDGSSRRSTRRCSRCTRVGARRRRPSRRRFSPRSDRSSCTCRCGTRRAARGRRRCSSAPTAQVLGVLGEDVFSTDGRRLEEVVGDAARGAAACGSRPPSRAPAASSRRGSTDVPGSSRYVGASVVAYANEAKTSLLGVPEALLADARGGERAGGACDGRGHSRARRRRSRRRHHRHRRPGRRHAGEARRHRGRRAGVAAAGTHARTFRFFGERELGQVPGLAGRARHGAATPTGASPRRRRQSRAEKGELSYSASALSAPQPSATAPRPTTLTGEARPFTASRYLEPEAGARRSPCTWRASGTTRVCGGATPAWSPTCACGRSTPSTCRTSGFPPSCG